MTIVELIGKLQQLPPDMLVCTEDGESYGFDVEWSAYRIPASVDRRDGCVTFASRFDSRYHQASEEIVVLSRWGQSDEAVEL